MSLVLETPRLTIRSWNDSPSDVDHAITLAQNSGYTSFSLPGQLVPTPEAAKELIKDRMNLFVAKRMSKFLVLLKGTSTPVGTCGLGFYAIDGQEELELGYRFCKEYWGRGLATEAAQAVLRYGFEDLDCQKIIAFALPENRASIRVMEKVGFKFSKNFVHADLPHQLYELRRSK